MRGDQNLPCSYSRMEKDRVSEFIFAYVAQMGGVELLEQHWLNVREPVEHPYVM